MLRSWLPLMAIVALAAVVRCQHLGAPSYYFDEAFCIKMIGFPAAEIWQRSALDNHPPLYFYLLSCWAGIFGESPAAARSLSVALGLTSVLGAYLLVRAICRWRVREDAVPDFGARHPHSGPLPEGEGEFAALAAAALVALSPLQVEWGQLVRMYVLGAALAIVSCWLLLRALHANRRRQFIAYALSAAALAYTHHFGLFIVAGQFVYAVGCGLMRRDRPPLIFHPSSFISHRSGLPLAFALVGLAYLPWASNFSRQRQHVSHLFHTKPFAWQEVAKACYQTLAARWEDEPPSAALAWAATGAYLVPALAMLVWGRGGLRLIGVCLLATFDGAICASIADRNIIQSRYFVFANALLLCGLPPLIAQTLGPIRFERLARIVKKIVGHRSTQESYSPSRQAGWGLEMFFSRDCVSSPPRSPSAQGGWGPDARRRNVPFVCVSNAVTAALVAGMAWLCLEHAARREGFARRPGMMAATAYVAEARRPGEGVLVCNPLLQVTASACAGGLPCEHVQTVSATGRAGKPLLPLAVQVLSVNPSSFPYFQGTAVMREDEYLSPEQLERSSARRVWAIDAVDWISPQWKLALPRPWFEVSMARFPEWAAADNCEIIVRCYRRGE